MTDVIQAAIVLRDRLAADAGLAKDRAEYIRSVANWNDAVRLVDALIALAEDKQAPESERLTAAELILDMNRTLSEG